MKYFVYSYNGKIVRERIVINLKDAIRLVKYFSKKYGSNTGFEILK